MLVSVYWGLRGINRIPRVAVRFIDVVTDKQLAKVDRANLTWSLCFDYPVRLNKNYIYICLLDLLTGFCLC